MNQDLRPAHVVPPGRILERELKSRGWTQRDLADVIDRPIQAINEIIRGSKQITPETAIELAAAFGTTPAFWTNLEAAYRLHLAEREQSDRDRQIARRSKLYSYAPVAELLRRSWISTTTDLDVLEQAVCNFFGITSLDETPQLSVAFRHSEGREPEVTAKIAWVRRVEQLGRKQPVPAFDRARLQRAIPNLISCAPKVEDVAHVPQILRDLGIRFVIVRHLPKTYIDGAVCDLHHSNPIIALTLRYDRIDSFWFTLMHELAHLVLDHQTPHVDNLDDQGHVAVEQEQQANEYATDWLINQQMFASFVTRTRPFFARTKVVQFASQAKIHPGVLVGQLQRRGEIPYTNLRSLLVKVSPYLSAWIDGSDAAAHTQEEGEASE